MPPDPQATRILILGAGKSGTSALFHCVAQSAERHFGRPFARLFEPKTQESLESLVQSYAVAKLLAERLQTFPAPDAALESFGRQLMIVRDPRDAVVSRLMWLVATRIGEAEPAAAARMLDALRQKEDEPGSISVIALYELAGSVAGFGANYVAKVRELAFLPLAMLRRFGGFHLLRYEDFVTRHFTAAEAYLGFPLLADFALPAPQGRILRTGQSGGWSNWFLDADDAYFSLSQGERMRALGYDPERPEGVVRRIGKEEATGYVARVQESIRQHGK